MNLLFFRYQYYESHNLQIKKSVFNIDMKTDLEMFCENNLI